MNKLMLSYLKIFVNTFREKIFLIFSTNGV
nr:MAG TPA: hypothetical protein [Caudoviricetes sp.]